VWVLEVIGEVTGMGYELANIVIFVFLQPGLILLFFILWRNQKNKNNKFKKIYNQNNERFR
jgi:preprotein translocase subunit YajC